VSRNEETLGDMAAEAAKFRDLVWALDSLGDGAQSEGVGEIDDAGRDG